MVWTLAHERLVVVFVAQRGRPGGAILETRAFLQAGPDVNAIKPPGSTEYLAIAVMFVANLTLLYATRFLRTGASGGNGSAADADAAWVFGTPLFEICLRVCVLFLYLSGLLVLAVFGSALRAVRRGWISSAAFVILVVLCGLFALDYAVQHCDAEFERTLRKVFFCSACVGLIFLIRDPNFFPASLADTRTLLHCALQCGCLDACGMLLDAGADTGLQDSQGRTAIAFARQFGAASSVAWYDSRIARGGPARAVA